MEGTGKRRSGRGHSSRWAPTAARATPDEVRFRRGPGTLAPALAGRVALAGDGGAICAGFGPEYSRKKTAAGEPPSELWDALASRGYLGVNLPEQYGGGGLGMAALAAVGEEISNGTGPSRLRHLALTLLGRTALRDSA